MFKFLKTSQTNETSPARVVTPKDAKEIFRVLKKGDARLLKADVWCLAKRIAEKNGTVLFEQDREKLTESVRIEISDYCASPGIIVAPQPIARIFTVSSNGSWEHVSVTFPGESKKEMQVPTGTQTSEHEAAQYPPHAMISDKPVSLAVPGWIGPSPKHKIAHAYSWLANAFLATETMVGSAYLIFAIPSPMHSVVVGISALIAGGAGVFAIGRRLVSGWKDETEHNLQQLAGAIETAISSVLVKPNMAFVTKAGDGVEDVVATKASGHKSGSRRILTWIET